MSRAQLKVHGSGCTGGYVQDVVGARPHECKAREQSWRLRARAWGRRVRVDAQGAEAKHKGCSGLIAWDAVRQEKICREVELFFVNSSYLLLCKCRTKVEIVRYWS
ncbi:hypothetical protein M5K25_016762 [Dendrobium thyrsiflorum]|uniref:Uncharacterized protein n=1 Tax=Dendrobium thyrsiflorum TaxID=117978 RepID=A0ABD0USG7_DENTH